MEIRKQIAKKKQLILFLILIIYFCHLILITIKLAAVNIQNYLN